MEHSNVAVPTPGQNTKLEDQDIAEIQEALSGVSSSLAPPSAPTPIPFSFSHHVGKPFVAISGLIGAGKTTLAEGLARRLRPFFLKIDILSAKLSIDLPVYHEPVADNPYLADFYRDMKTYGFAMQVFLLNERFKQHQEIFARNAGGVQDRTIYEDTIFARVLHDQGNMSDRDYATYLDLFSNFLRFLCKPTCIIHIDVAPEESLRRIMERRRECEQTISLQYLQQLNRAYELFLSDISPLVPIIKVHVDESTKKEELADFLAEEIRQLEQSNIRVLSLPPRK